MVIKINYTSSDVYVSTSVSPVYVVVNYSGTGGGGGGAVWGGITGTLSDQTDLQTALDGKVPYTGATANVNLGEFGLATGQVTLDTTPTGTAVVGTTRWNDTAGITETTLKGGNVILKNGVDLVARVVNKVTPNATLTKAAYQAVRVSGAQGQRLAVALAQANNDANSADTIGLVTETIATNQEGFIMTMGQLENINTTGSLQGETWVDGDVLYLSPTTPGAITKVKPTGAGHIVVIGYVEYAHVNNGKIYVKVMNGWELDELHDVDIVTPANNEALIYESSTALWKNKTIATALGYTPISGTGATGQLAYWNGTNSQTGSNNLFWDAANSRLGIGTNAPSGLVDIVGTLVTSRYLSTGSLSLIGTNTTAAAQTVLTLSTGVSNQTGPNIILSKSRGQLNEVITDGDFIGTIQFQGGNGSASVESSRIQSISRGTFSLTSRPSSLSFFTTSSGSTTVTERMRIFQTGNIIFQDGGTFTDGGQRLQVYGDAFIKGSGATGSTIALSVVNSSNQANLTIYNDRTLSIGGAVNSYIGATSNNYYILNFAMETSANGMFYIGGSNLTLTAGESNQFGTVRAFAPTSGTATHTGIKIAYTINQTGGANGITRGLYVNPTLTAAADWRSIEWSNNTGWGLYGAGTANNYLGGKLLLNSNSDNGNYSLQVNGGGSIYGSGNLLLVKSTGQYLLMGEGTGNNQYGILNWDATNNMLQISTQPFEFGTSGGQINLPLSGNILLGTTTDAGFKLDVNGTARVSGAATFSSSVTATSFIKSGGTSSQYLMADGSVTTGGGGSVDELQVSLICQVFG